MVRAISYILLVFFSIILVVSIPLGAAAFTANSTFLKPYSSNTYLVKSGLNSGLKLAIKESVAGSQPDKNTSALQQLRYKLVGQAFDSIVTDDLVAQKINLLQIAMWDYFTNKSKTILTVPIPELSAALKAADIKLGTNTDIFSLLGGKTTELENIKITYQSYKKGTLVIYILLPIVLTLCFLLAQSLNRSRWIGVCLVIGGVLSLLLWLPVTYYTNNFIVPNRMQNLSQEIINLIMLARYDFLSRLSLAAASVLLVGIIVMFIGRHRRIEVNHERL